MEQVSLNGEPLDDVEEVIIAESETGVHLFTEADSGGLDQHYLVGEDVYHAELVHSDDATAVVLQHLKTGWLRAVDEDAFYEAIDDEITPLRKVTR